MPQIVSVKRDVAEATRPELGGAYEGCLDQFERGMSTERLREVFAELKSGLVPLLRAIQEKVAYQLYFRFIEPPKMYQRHRYRCTPLDVYFYAVLYT